MRPCLVILFLQSALCLLAQENFEVFWDTSSAVTSFDVGKGDVYYVGAYQRHQSNVQIFDRGGHLLDQITIPGRGYPSLCYEVDDQEVLLVMRFGRVLSYNRASGALTELTIFGAPGGNDHSVRLAHVHDGQIIAFGSSNISPFADKTIHESFIIRYDPLTKALSYQQTDFKSWNVRDLITYDDGWIVLQRQSYGTDLVFTDHDFQIQERYTLRGLFKKMLIDQDGHIIATSNNRIVRVIRGCEPQTLLVTPRRSNFSFIGYDSFADQIVLLQERNVFFLSGNLHIMIMNIDGDLLFEKEINRKNCRTQGFAIYPRETDLLITGTACKTDYFGPQRAFLMSMDRFETPEEQFDSPKLKLAPNPTDGHLRVDVLGSPSARHRVHLFDLSGRHLREFNIGTHSCLDLGALSKGTYLMQVSTANKTLTKKLVKF